METDDLTAFIEARLAEDEELARDAAEAWPGGTWSYVVTPGGDHKVVNGGGYSVLGHYDIDSAPWAAGPHVARHDPARALREVAAKRVILARHQPEEQWIGHEHMPSGRQMIGTLCSYCRDGNCESDYDMTCGRFDWPCIEVCALVSVWSDHPDYRTEWAL